MRSDGDWAGCHCTNLGTLGSLVKLTSQEIELFHSSFPEYTRQSHEAGHPFLGVLNKRMLNSDLVKSQTSHREVETHTGNTFPSLCPYLSYLGSLGPSRTYSHTLIIAVEQTNKEISLLFSEPFTRISSVQGHFQQTNSSSE